MSVGFTFFFRQDLFLMDAAVHLVVIDAQQAAAIRKLASSALSRCLQHFCHGYPLSGVSHAGIRRTDIPERQGPNFKHSVYHSFLDILQLFFASILRINGYIRSFSSSAAVSLRTERPFSCLKYGLCIFWCVFEPIKINFIFFVHSICISSIIDNSSRSIFFHLSEISFPINLSREVY